ncbi:terminus macrodomain insulation protein YfbV [Thalassomonas sp. M1454]|uniref:terminus macrodomain insulation protein YfbV n=1 Tax=Thalassomonas sp. M1454 TaxID=2594477 RepID=UPI00117CEA19|nr:terminus macrodomain insulation protein YfbV [Thalassomonas sp. M1454]TRX56720.1 DUF412 domain-containing protein [Thalassomonas sp. M1454]
MNLSIKQQLKQGKEYIDLWPLRPELSNYFSEYQAIVASRFVLKHCPYLALVAFILPLFAFGVDKLTVALFYGVCIASMPVQALFFMAKKSREPLPPALARWYREGVEKIKIQTLELEEKFSTQKPTFNDLAKLLNYSYLQR